MKISSIVRDSRAADILAWPYRKLRIAQFRRRIKAQDDVVHHLKSLLVEDPMLHVACFLGDFYIAPSSELFRRLAMTGTYESELAKACTEYVDPAFDAIDVGANIGFYTILLAKLVKGNRVLAIEPTRNALTRLKKNVAANLDDHSVVIFEGAVSNKNGTSQINFVEGSEEYSSLGVLLHEAIADKPMLKSSVSTRTIDDLVAQFRLRPGFIKIDVEGMEYAVLEGAKQTLSEFRPIILAEVSDGLLKANNASAASLLNLVKSAGYVTIDPDNSSLPSGSIPLRNVLCVPIQKTTNAAKFG